MTVKLWYLYAKAGVLVLFLAFAVPLVFIVTAPFALLGWLFRSLIVIPEDAMNPPPPPPKK